LELTGPIGAVPVHNRHPTTTTIIITSVGAGTAGIAGVGVGVVVVGCGGEDVGKEFLGDRPVSDVACGDGRVGDDLRVGVFRDVALVAVKPAG
jgi:hypothetical protein